MEAKTELQLIEVRALKPFVGSYPCALADADTIDDVLSEKDGQVIKTRQPRKKFIGRIPTRRFARAHEVTAINAGEPLPPGLEIVPMDPRHGGKRSAVDPIEVQENPVPATLNLPEDIARDLAARGLAEIVGKAKRR